VFFEIFLQTISGSLRKWPPGLHFQSLRRPARVSCKTGAPNTKLTSHFVSRLVAQLRAAELSAIVSPIPSKHDLRVPVQGLLTRTTVQVCDPKAQCQIACGSYAPRPGAQTFWPQFLSAASRQSLCCAALWDALCFASFRLWSFMAKCECLRCAALWDACFFCAAVFARKHTSCTCAALHHAFLRSSKCNGIL